MDGKLKALQDTIYSIVASHQEPSTAFKICREYEEEYGSINFAEFGYYNGVDMLKKHPRIQLVEGEEGRVVFRAAISTTGAAYDIQKLIAHQRKKKSRSGGSGRGRPVFHNRYATPNRVSPQAFNRTSTQFVMRPRPPMPALQQRPAPSPLFSPVRASLAGRITIAARPSPLKAAVPAAPVAARPAAAPSQRRNVFAPVPVMAAKPVTSQDGIKRFVTLIDDMGGYATLTDFRRRWYERHSELLTAEVFARYFGEPKLSAVWQALEGKVTFEFIETEGEEDLGMYTVKYVDRGRTLKPAHPSLSEMLNNLINQLTHVYPAPLPFDKVPIYYARFYKQQLRPEELFSKTWREVFFSVFMSALQVDEEDKVRLRKKPAAVTTATPSATSNKPPQKTMDDSW
ncbi:unnamed protein product, partial [Mesorhabditis spiculigera]